jgi:hypothetical protein
MSQRNMFQSSRTAWCREMAFNRFEKLKRVQGREFKNDRESPPTTEGGDGLPIQDWGEQQLII